MTTIVNPLGPCPICCDTFTTTVRAPIHCIHCKAQTCTVCVKRYMLGTPSDPHCMHCRGAWNREFIDTHLTRSWREGDLRTHRAKVLFDRERSLLPATQPALETERHKSIFRSEVKALRARVDTLKRDMLDIKNQIDRRMYFITTGRHRQDGGAVLENSVDRRHFIAACPISDCRGFLSTAYKCGTCTTQFCPACREVKPGGENHVCNEELVATMAAIAKDTRPCPRCGIAISKVNGCDQMFCTNCNTAFSWITGKIQLGAIHNPHYFERMQELARAGPEIVPGCNNGMIQWPPLHTILNKLQPGGIRVPVGQKLALIYQSGVHVEQHVLRNAFAVVDGPALNEDIRVRYLLKQIDERRFKNILQRRDRDRTFNIEVRESLELFVLLTMEFFVEIHRTFPKTIVEDIDRIVAQIYTHVNEPLVVIGQRYRRAVPQLRYDSDTARRAQCRGGYGRGGYGYIDAGWAPPKAKAKAKAKAKVEVESISISDSNSESESESEPKPKPKAKVEVESISYSDSD